MLLPLRNSPREYAWGSKTLIPQLEGRDPTGRPEAEVWYGDHPEDPAETLDGRLLTDWFAHERPELGRLPYLLKLLAAGSALSIQTHPSKPQAEAGFAREQAAGIPLSAPNRIYRDDNHKPELIVAVSEKFQALVGLRDLETTQRLADHIGTKALRERLSGSDVSFAEIINWILSPASSKEVRAIIEAACAARSAEFIAELDLARSLQATYPQDPGIVVALLMNLVTLDRGDGLFVPAGVLHAYVHGLGVEVMASSDNVLRGGLTRKHIDVEQLLSVLDATPAPPILVHPTPGDDGVDRYDVHTHDFTLQRATATTTAQPTVTTPGTCILLAVAGTVTVTASRSKDVATLRPGQGLLVTLDEGSVQISGDGQLFLTGPGEHVDP